MMMNSSNGVAVSGFFCCFLVLLALGSALSIAELVLFQQYKDNHPDCNNGQVVDPLIWLEVDGIVNLVAGIIFLFVVFGLCGLEMVALVCGTGLIVLTSLFEFCWVIVGAVMLWRDNLNCAPQPLHDILWATVLIRLIFMANACLGRPDNS